MRERIKREFKEFTLLIGSVPPVTFSLFVIAVFSMNLLANKSISLPVDWLALDCGMTVSWFAFLTMDMLTRRFGPKAATELSLFAILINLILCLIFFVCSVIPGLWSKSVPGSEDVINSALDGTFGGTWYVVMGSTVAFATSAVINNFTNWGVGKAFKSADGVLAYIFRSYISTAIGQFADNLVFALIVSHIFFGWTIVQCLTCAVTGMLFELLCEVVFSYFGYRMCEKWKKNGIGEKYLAAVAKDKKEKSASKTEV